MKRMVFLVVLVVAVSGAAWASSSVDFTNNGGHSFVASGHGVDGISNEVVFRGSLSGPATSNLVTLADGTHNYALSGSGLGYSGAMVNSANTRLTFNAHFTGQAALVAADYNCKNMVPEPGTLGMLGTGLIGLAGALRLKSKA